MFVVVNAGSGDADSDATCGAIESELTAAGRPFEIQRVTAPEELPAAAAQAVAKAQAASGIVVAAGGDGTLNAVAQAVLGSGCPFGVVPHGTFNYFGRAHCISSDAAEATRALLSAEVQPVQVGLVNDRPFLVNASLGLYPQTLERREEEKQRLGRRRWVALWAALLTIFRGDYRPMRIEIEQDGRIHRLRTLTLFVGNNRLQLEQVGLDEAETVERGKLVAVVLKPVPALALLWVLLQGALGRLGQTRGVRHFALSRMTVAPAGRRTRRLKVATDGEICWMTAPIEFRVAPEPLLLLVPARAAAEGAP